MKRLFVLPLISLILFSCKQEINKKDLKNLKIVKTSPNTYQHISFLKTETYGNVPCNGMVVVNDNEALIFDTPTTIEATEELIKWVKDSLKCEIKAIIPTHFHVDCVGGLSVFHKNGVPSYANQATTELINEKDASLPQNSFNGKKEFFLGDKKVIAQFFGEGHTKDNIVGYFPNDNILFGGCLIKANNASKGNLNDANIKDWSSTVKKIKESYPNIRTVIPGHGDSGDIKLLDYTINMFEIK
ncbi:subclass B1 metallo-beta-lactamase [Tenacibaculum caenipelagi]|uniref:beta-lactamase n=1 Tax=Tenacibaculum caenipelagi TaxID=1325435 RepID=A0A4R6TFG5_9FLAO|nr:subclass B1 metallo-beta-lactamase [Tenacibaculum caenipelagi]TDQ28543.1 metallo-beta-lactamase class B [Tenacibaculum caenipelagi]